MHPDRNSALQTENTLVILRQHYDFCDRPTAQLPRHGDGALYGRVEAGLLDPLQAGTGGQRLVFWSHLLHCPDSQHLRSEWSMTSPQEEQPGETAGDEE